MRALKGNAGSESIGQREIAFLHTPNRGLSLAMSIRRSGTLALCGRTASTRVCRPTSTKFNFQHGKQHFIFSFRRFCRLWPGKLWKIHGFSWATPIVGGVACVALGPRRVRSQGRDDERAASVYGALHNCTRPRRFP